MGGERRPFFLLRGNKMTPVEVMSFPKVTELAGNRLFSWALETIGTHRKGMVLELDRLTLSPLHSFMHLHCGISLPLSGTFGGGFQSI